MGLNPLPAPVDTVSIACWPWGAYLGDDGIAHGVRMKISRWQRHDPNAMPPAAKGTGMYVNSSLAKIEAVKAGYDEAILLSPQGYVSECTGENLFIVQGGTIVTPPLSAGALEGITQDCVRTLADRSRASRTRRATCCGRTSTPPTRRFLSGTAAEIVPIRSVDDREIGEPGPITRQIQEVYANTVRGKVDQHKDWNELSPSPRPRGGPAGAVEIFDTTLRDGSQREGVSLSVDDKLTDRPSSSTTSASTTSRAGGRAPTPRTRSSSGVPRPS